MSTKSPLTPHAPPNNITGLILAGGLARRMGADKGLIKLAGKPLIAHAVSRLRPQVANIIINTNRNAAAYAEAAPEADQIIPDEITGYAGPLAGIHAGMTAAAAIGQEWLMTVPCDSPFFPADIVAQLQTAAEKANAIIAVPSAEGRPQPVFMLTRTDLAEDIEQTLESGNAKIAHWYSRHPHIIVPFEDIKAFDNINTPEDLTAAEQRL